MKSHVMYYLRLHKFQCPLASCLLPRSILEWFSFHLLPVFDILPICFYFYTNCSSHVFHSCHFFHKLCVIKKLIQMHFAVDSRKLKCWFQEQIKVFYVAITQERMLWMFLPLHFFLYNLYNYLFFYIITNYKLLIVPLLLITVFCMLFNVL